MIDLRFGARVDECEALGKDADHSIGFYGRLLLIMGLLVAGSFLAPIRLYLIVLAGFAGIALGMVGAVRVYLRVRSRSMVRQGLSALEWTADERRTPRS